MLQTMQLFQGLQAAVSAAFPHWTIYLDQLPESMTRPACLIQLQHRQATDESIHTVQVTADFLLTGYEPLDAATDQRLADATAALDVFAAGKIPVGDRMLTVSADFTGKDVEVFFRDHQGNYRKRTVAQGAQDVFFLDVRFQYCDDRGLSAPPPPLMEELITNI